MLVDVATNCLVDGSDYGLELDDLVDYCCTQRG